MAKSSKSKYSQAQLLITTANLLATIEQESLLHPYLDVRQMATEAVPVLQGLLRTLASESLSKNEALNRIAHYPTNTRGGAAILPKLRTFITANRLDQTSALRSIESARRLYDATHKAATAAQVGPTELATIEWCAKALDRLEGKMDQVNWFGLVAMSHVAAQYPFPDD